MKNTHIAALAIVVALCLGGVAIGVLSFLRHQADSPAGQVYAEDTDAMSPGAGGSAGGTPKRAGNQV